MSLRDQLQKIEKDHGALTPRVVVDAARDENHPLHERFEWEDSVAGERWRTYQAAQLIRSVRVTYKPGTDSDAPRSVRAFHAVRTENGNVYRGAEDIANDEFARALVLSDMEREWKQLLRRYREFEEFLSMVRTDIEDVA